MNHRQICARWNARVIGAVLGGDVASDEDRGADLVEGSETAGLGRSKLSGLRLKIVCSCGLSECGKLALTSRRGGSSCASGSRVRRPCFGCTHAGTRSLAEKRQARPGRRSLPPYRDLPRRSPIAVPFRLQEFADRSEFLHRDFSPRQWYWVVPKSRS
jgi:hypothetical protein